MHVVDMVTWMFEKLHRHQVLLTLTIREALSLRFTQIGGNVHSDNSDIGWGWTQKWKVNKQSMGSSHQPTHVLKALIGQAPMRHNRKPSCSFFSHEQTTVYIDKCSKGAGQMFQSWKTILHILRIQPFAISLYKR